MGNMTDMGKMLLFVGGIIFLLGLLFTFAPRIPLLGRLPGDIRIERENFSCFFPLATSIVLSIILTIVLNVIARLMNK